MDDGLVVDDEKAWMVLGNVSFDLGELTQVN
jgi:hypothetical protein